MAAPARKTPEPRWHRHFRGADHFAEDLGTLGAWVGPRTGPGKRLHGEKEDYVLRRLLVAWNLTGRLSFPFDAEAPADSKENLDFVITPGKGDSFGVAVTEAGTEDYPAWLSTAETENASDAPRSPPVRSESFVKDVGTAIEQKNQRVQSGHYRSVGQCDVAVYLNTASGEFLDKTALIDRIRDTLTGPRAFRAVHLVSEKTVWLNVHSENFQSVPVAGTYEIDYAAWIFDQVEKLRKKNLEDVDARNVAEELSDLGISEERGLKSHLQRLLMHLLKWMCQPDRRGPSWENSIQLARLEIGERTMRSPSLKRVFHTDYEKIYRKARLEAASETKLPVSTFPETPPFTVAQALDQDFLPDNRPPDEE